MKLWGSRTANSQFQFQAQLFECVLEAVDPASMVRIKHAPDDFLGNVQPACQINIADLLFCHGHCQREFGLCPINKLPGFAKFCVAVTMIGNGMFLKIESDIAVTN